MQNFFHWYCRTDLADAIEGDLLELYDRRVVAVGKFKADLLFFWNVLTFIQPFAFKKRKNLFHPLNTMDMLRNYFKIAFRTLRASKSFTLINVVGLALGISAFMIMASFIIGELSYDRFHEKGDRIHRITYSYLARGAENHVARAPFPLKTRLLDEYPELDQVVRFYQNRMDISTLEYKEKIYTEENLIFVDPEVFEVFDFKLERGNAKTALKEMNSIVLTAGAAKKYFGDEDPMGQVLTYKGDDQLRVTGILETPNAFSHIQFDMLVPNELQRSRWMREGGNNGYDFEQDWKWSGAWMYVLLKKGSDENVFSKRLLTAGEDWFGRFKGKEVKYQFKPQRLADVYFQSNLISQIGVNGNLIQVYAFSAVALLILFIACVNFINLSTARSAKRAKEVGLRKVMGALKPQLIGQFVSESILICAMAAVLAILMVEVLLPFFSMFVEKEVTIPYFEHPEILLMIVAGVVIIGFLSGIYPSFYLSAFQPVQTLKGNYEDKRKGHMGMRKFLVIAQFAVSNILIIGILVIHAQLNFLKEKDLGFEKDQTIILKHGSKVNSQFQLFKDRVQTIPYAKVVNQGYVAGGRAWSNSFRVNGQDVNEGKSLGLKLVSFGFVDMYGLEVVAGRNFIETISSDSSESILINESTARTFGWSNEEALNQRFSYVGGSDNKTLYKHKVIGVLKDANFEALYKPVKPSVFKVGNWGDVAIKFEAPNNEALYAAIDQVEIIWDEMSLEWPFEYTFLDQQIADQYKKDLLLGQMIQYLGILAILIACLGLFGLASFSVQKRTKEIGVRKVMGATIQSVLLLISKGFLTLVIIAFLISIPLGYFLSSQWLQEFAFRITLGPWAFFIAGMISILVSLIAVSSQSLRAALLNPIQSLRYE